MALLFFLNTKARAMQIQWETVTMKEVVKSKIKYFTEQSKESIPLWQRGENISDLKRQ